MYLGCLLFSLYMLLVFENHFIAVGPSDMQINISFCHIAFRNISKKSELKKHYRAQISVKHLVICNVNVKFKEVSVFTQCN